MSLRLYKAVCYATLLSRKLAAARLSRHSTIVRRSTSRLLVRDDVVCSSSIVASPVLAIGHLLVCIVWIWVLKDHIPGVKEARKEAETAEGEVDERVGAAKTFLDPDAYRWELVDV